MLINVFAIKTLLDLNDFCCAKRNKGCNKIKKANSTPAVDDYKIVT